MDRRQFIQAAGGMCLMVILSQSPTTKRTIPTPIVRGVTFQDKILPGPKHMYVECTFYNCHVDGLFVHYHKQHNRKHVS